MEVFGSYVSLALSVIALAGIFYNWLTSGGTKALEQVSAHKAETAKRFGEIEKAFEERCDEMEAGQRLKAEAILQRFGMVDLRMAKMEEALKHLPDRGQAHDLAMAMEKMSGQIVAMEAKLTGRIDTLDERLRPVAAATARLQNYLIEKGAEE